jgi:hypothetical protein
VLTIPLKRDTTAIFLSLSLLRCSPSR